MRAGGARSTAAALDLAVAQLRAGATDPRLVVLYTGAPDAGGEPAATVVERMRAAGVVLAVVGSGETASPFWTAVAEGTGGMAVTAGPSGVIGAFDQVTAALGTRYLVTFPAPARLPATVAVQVDTAGGPVSTEATVTPAAAPPGSGGTGPVVAVAIGGIIAVVLVAGAVVLVRRRAGGRRNGAVVGPVWSIPPLPGDLVDRAAVREEVTAAVQRGGPVWLRPHPDVEGLGTTTAMLDFAHRNRDRYDVAWWVPARDADLVPDRLAELAEALDLATATDSAERSATALLEALSRRNRWLLVFDDAAGPRQLARYLPDGPGHVLISSSDAGWQEQACPVTVPAFTRAESVSLLRSRCPDLSAEAADRIAARLDDLPLAVDPAAAVLADPDTDADAVLDALPGAPAPWEAVWDLARDRLADADPAALALLTLAAWLGPAPVPLALLTDHPDVLPEPLAAASDPGARRPRRVARSAWPGPGHRRRSPAAPDGRRAAHRPDCGRARGRRRVGGDRRAPAGGRRPGPAGPRPQHLADLAVAVAARGRRDRPGPAARDRRRRGRLAARRRRHLPGGARPLARRQGAARRRARVRRRRPAADRR